MGGGGGGGKYKIHWLFNIICLKLQTLLIRGFVVVTGITAPPAHPGILQNKQPQASITS